MLLSEQIKCILQSNDTLAAKTEKLSNLNLTQIDIRYLLAANQVQTQNANTPRVSRKLTFGVEIECKVNDTQFFENCYNTNTPIKDNRSLRYSYYHHDTENCFKVVNDGSVRAMGDLKGIECVSNILQTKDLPNLKKICVNLQKANGKTDKECGLHIHVGLQGLNAEQKTKIVKNILTNYYYLQNVINSFMPYHRVNNTYCKMLSTYKIENLQNANSMYEITNHIFDGDDDRYYVVNVQSILRHNTIEFRQHNGSIYYNVIEHWVKFLLKLVEFSKQNVFSENVNSIYDIPFLSENEKIYFNDRKNKLYH